MSNTVRFQVEAQREHARVGLLEVRGRSTPTPAFMPVGTQGTVKGMWGRELVDLGYQAILANTYHLHLRPGSDVVERQGGLHRWMDYPGILLTDSGGFQVFSLASRRKMDDDGVTFQSHLDGSSIRLTPEIAMQIQHRLDSDIAMVLDECPPAKADNEAHEQAVQRSLAWAKRSLVEHRKLSDDRATFAIVQGGQSAELRRQMADELHPLDFDGYALGGVSVGEGRREVLQEISSFAQFLPAESPRYLMGVASPYELWHAVRHGIDLFDCVMPTRNARNGYLYTRSGVLKMRNACHTEDSQPVEASCPCLLCQNYSRSYLRHLFAAGEMLGPMLATRHNLTFYSRFLSDLRLWIRNEAEVNLDWLEYYA